MGKLIIAARRFLSRAQGTVECPWATYNAMPHWVIGVWLLAGVSLLGLFGTALATGHYRVEAASTFVPYATTNIALGVLGVALALREAYRHRRCRA